MKNVKSDLLFVTNRSADDTKTVNYIEELSDGKFHPNAQNIYDTRRGSVDHKQITLAEMHLYFEVRTF